MSSRTRYAPQQQPRFGTMRRDPFTGNQTGGEVNERGEPMGTPRPQTPARPFAPTLTSFQGGAGTPNLDAMKLRNFPGAATVGAPAGQRSGNALPAPAKDEFGRPMMAAPSTGAMPARLAAPVGNFPLPSNPDDRALLMETRARDAAARAPEPISIPGGDPAARAWNTARGTGHPSTPEPGAVAPVVAPNGFPMPAVAGTVRYHVPGTPEAAAVVSNTGVVRPQSTPTGVTASAQARHDAGPTLPAVPFTPGPAPLGTVANSDSSTMGFPRPATSPVAPAKDWNTFTGNFRPASSAAPSIIRGFTSDSNGAQPKAMPPSPPVFGDEDEIKTTGSAFPRPRKPAQALFANQDQ